MNLPAVAARSAAVACLLLTGCPTPSAVRDFAAVSARASALFPAVAAIEYDSCVARNENDQLSKLKTFSPDFALDQSQIEAACAEAKKTRERLQQTYAVLSAYIEALTKLANDDIVTFDKKAITTDAGLIAGLSDRQRSAVGGLINVVTNALTRGWRERMLAEAIREAEPHVQVLARLFEDDVQPILARFIRNEEDSLGSLYREAQANPPGTSPILTTMAFRNDHIRIEKEKEELTAFGTMFKKLAEGHTELFNARTHLYSRDTLQAVYQTTADLREQVVAVESTFK
jgi:septal ring factor EnvC (AmiA/AmiB activator)